MKVNKQIPDSYKNQTLEKIEQIENELDTVNDSLNELSSNLSNSNFYDALKWNRLDSVTDVGSTSSNFIQLPNKWNECHIEVNMAGLNAVYTIRLISFDSYGYYRAGQAEGQYAQVSTNMVIVGFFDNKIFLEQAKINGESVISVTSAHCWYR